MRDPNRNFGFMVTEYMNKKAESVRLHHVRQCGTQELKFEVSPKDTTWHETSNSCKGVHSQV
jgi:hypothetical protein